LLCLTLALAITTSAGADLQSVPEPIYPNLLSYK